MTTVQKLTPLGQLNGDVIRLDRRRRKLSNVMREHHRNRCCLVYRIPYGQIFDPERHVVKMSLWPKTLVGKDDCILILPLVGKTGGGSQNGLAKASGIALTVAAIALAVFHPYLVGLLTPALGAFGAQAASVGIPPQPLLIGDHA